MYMYNIFSTGVKGTLHTNVHTHMHACMRIYLHTYILLFGITKTKHHFHSQASADHTDLTLIV